MHAIDHYADDLAALTEHLDLRDVVHLGHSSWGREVGQHLARHGDGFPGGMPTARAIRAGLRY